MNLGSPGSFRLITPPGEGGIAVFVVEGPRAREALLRTVRPSRLAALQAGELAYGRFFDADGAVLDEVIVAALPSRDPGEERFELNCHAGGAAAAAVAERLGELGLIDNSGSALDSGAPARDGEFLRMLASVRTRRQLEALCRWRAGGMTAGSEPAAILKTYRVVLAGPVNAGKSTLFNRLAGSDLAIVSARPGTTRDSIAALISIRGLAVELVDTAGLGPVDGDSLAPSAQELTLREVAGADLVLLVLDGSLPLAAKSRPDLPCGPRTPLTVFNKSDLGDGSAEEAAADGADSLRVSARTGAGFDALMAKIEKMLLAPVPVAE